MHLARDGRATSVSEAVTAACHTAGEETGAKRNPEDTAIRVVCSIKNKIDFRVSVSHLGTADTTDLLTK